MKLHIGIGIDIWGNKINQVVACRTGSPLGGRGGRAGPRGASLALRPDSNEPRRRCILIQHYDNLKRKCNSNIGYQFLALLTILYTFEDKKGTLEEEKYLQKNMYSSP